MKTLSRFDGIKRRMNETNKTAYKLLPDSVSHPDVIQLIEAHVQNMRELSPPESTHTLPLNELRAPEVSCWSLWVDDSLAGFAALKELAGVEGEIKSMRTAPEFLRRGVAAKLLENIITEAKARGYQCLYLETGSFEAFAAARTLYQRFGFEYCGPFADYKEDPNSIFMRLNLINQ